MSDPVWIHTPRRVARYGVTSYVAHVAHACLDWVPWPLRPLVWRAVLGRMGTGVILEHRVFLRPPRYIWLGHDVFIGRGSQLWAHSATAGIAIGDHVLLGPDVLVTTLGHRYEDPAMPVVARPVVIGARCWIGARAVILPGVTLGEGVVVAAGSVVAEDIPAWTVVAGVPARVVKRRELDAPPEPAPG